LLGNCGGSRIQTWNRYAYVANNPLGNVDPLGLVDGPTNCGQDGQCYAQWAKDFSAQFAGGVNQGPRGSWTAASEFWLMSKPVTVTAWGWIPVTPSTTNFAGPSTSNGTIDDVLAYFGQQSVQVGTGLDLFTSSLLSAQGTETPAQAFNRIFNQKPATDAVRGPSQSTPVVTPQQASALCSTAVQLRNNGMNPLSGLSGDPLYAVDQGTGIFGPGMLNPNGSGAGTITQSVGSGFAMALGKSTDYQTCMNVYSYFYPHP
jgi:hypothetical protein